MTEQEPATRTLELTEVNDQLASLVRAVYRGELRIEIEQGGIPVAALVAPGDLVRLIQTAQAWNDGTRVLECFSAAFADVSTADIEANVDEIIGDLRQRADMETERRPA